MDEMVCIYKKRGETPLEALERLRVLKPEFKNEKLSYAGRLDPMAEGLLLVLVGLKNKDREKYLGLSKKYEVDILFGVDTDTGDILGKILGISKTEIKEKDILETLKFFKGEISQRYPDFSSKTVDGKALFEHSRLGNRIADIYHKVFVENIVLEKYFKISSKDFLKKIKNDISLISGDFRQNEILNIYEKEFKNLDCDFNIATLEFDVSSGFYIRQFVKDFAEKLATKALAFRIKRLKVGDFQVVDCLS